MQQPPLLTKTSRSAIPSNEWCLHLTESQLTESHLSAGAMLKIQTSLRSQTSSTKSQSQRRIPLLTRWWRDTPRATRPAFVCVTSVLCSALSPASIFLVNYMEQNCTLGTPEETNSFQFFLLTFFQVISEGFGHFLCLLLLPVDYIGIGLADSWKSARSLSNKHLLFFLWRNYYTPALWNNWESRQGRGHTRGCYTVTLGQSYERKDRNDRNRAWKMRKVGQPTKWKEICFFFCK